MSQKYNVKMNLNLSGTSFTDETHSNVGASAITLDHDFFINDIASGDVLVIRTAAAGGGTLLTENTDYTVSNQDTILSDATHVNKNVYSDITITNAVYQAGALYFSGKYVADSVDKSDVSQITWQYETASASATLAPTSYTTYGCTAGTNGIRLTLPASSEYYKNLKLTFVKLDDTNTSITIKSNGSETISGQSYIFLIEQYQKIEIMNTGSAWVITSGTLIADSGFINRSDYTSVSFGTMEIPYDNLVGTFTIGEKVTQGTVANTWIIIADSVSVLNVWRATGTGFATNNYTLTGSQSGATALVNTGTTTKNINYNFWHGFGKPFWNISKELILNSTAVEAGAISMIHAEAAANAGISFIGVDTNSFVIDTQTNGFYAEIGGNATTLIDAEDWYYRIIVRLIF